MKIHIQGLVRLANRVRQLLAGPLTAAEIQALRQQVNDALHTVHRLLAEQRSTPSALPAPSRNAYHFLAGIDFTTLPAAAHTALPPPAMRFPGLRRQHEALLLHLITAPPDQAVSAIQKASRQLEQAITQHGLSADQLSSEARAIRGWLAYFADKAAMQTYFTAAGHARQAFTRHLSDNQHQRPLHVQFRPLSSLARVKPTATALQVMLPTPMICFTPPLFEQLAALSLHRQRQHREALLTAMAADEYQDIQAELEALGGVVEQTAGAYHDLQQSFERVNAAYFQGQQPRPRLTWSRSFTQRKYGHYDPVRDVVMLSVSLDRADVPAFVVDFVLYHELLHKRHGVNWRNGRAQFHTADFRQAEQQFAQHVEAERLLAQLARS